MKYIVFTFMVAIQLNSAFAQAPIEVEIVGPPADHLVRWTTSPGYSYRIAASPDLDAWQDSGHVFPWSGGLLEYHYQSLDDRWFYRIEEAEDLDKVAFLTLPVPGHELLIEDGVPFAFDLTVFPQFPDKIRIYKKVYNSGTDWDLIGELDHSMDASLEYFTEIRGVRVARGSVVWLPTDLGDYEVRATAVDADERVIGDATRLISVTANSPPSVVIETGPLTSATERQDAVFTTTVTDPDDDEIRRVEFFDNGVLMGTDTVPPFGDIIIDPTGSPVEYLWKGEHLIRARAYDFRGAGGDLSASFDVTITGGNSQPLVNASVDPLHNGILTIRFNASDPDLTGFIASVQAENLGNYESASAANPQGSYPYNAIYMNTGNWVPGTHTLAVVATDNVGTSSYPFLVEVPIPGPLPPIPGYTQFATNLAAEIADESTVTITNARFTGAEDSSGLFDYGVERGLQLAQGVVLTTGYHDSWNTGDLGTNDRDNLFEQTTKQWDPNDEDLGDEELFRYVFGSSTKDAAVLEFDVVSVNGQLVIDYQFGTEEYDEFVQVYNDAFLISVDGVPVSLLPDCTDIVGVQSVSLSNNRHLFLGDDEDIDGMVDPSFESTKVEYDGLTVRLRANALVTPGDSHHVRIVIADVRDDAYDAALFLGRASLKSIQPQP